MILFSLVLIPTVVSAEKDFSEKGVEPADGELLLPDDYDQAEQKKCLMVCERWGQDCIINPQTGSRKCRRMCKSLTEECF